MLVVLIPTYNEEDNVTVLYKGITSFLPDVPKTYLFVDDHSSDNTVKKLKELFEGKNLILLEKETNKGPGHSFNLGFNYILDNLKDCTEIITVEADSTIDYKDLEKLYAIKKIGFDLVLASPYAQGGGFNKTSFFRKFLSFWANILIRSIFNIKILTVSSFVRIYDLKKLQEVKAKYGEVIENPGFFSMTEALLKFVRTHAVVIEMPVTVFSDRRQGKSKMKILKTSYDYFINLIKLNRKLNKYERTSKK